MKLTVTANADGTSGYTDLYVELVNFIEYDRLSKRLVVHAHTGVFYMTGPLNYCKNALKSSGYKFIYATRSSIFNADNVVSVNTLFKDAYFKEGVNGKKSKCEISHNRFVEAMAKLEVYNPSVSFS
ncbi:hypothetical protein ACIFQM_00745 [Paenibacillus sp. NRS-1782]|uniref:hypothetical protein n=1 Tax=unclassified Paenibacillus TaxID=185978 RepID=UPI003D2B05E3